MASSAGQKVYTPCQMITRLRLFPALLDDPLMAHSYFAWLIPSQVTTDPRSKQEIPEAVGAVTSDSLAAESLKGDGSFGAGNPHAAASKQPSKSTTTNTTDTSSATKLDPAPDAEAREAREGWSETSQLNANKGLGKGAGVGPTYATSGGSTGGSTGGGNVPIAPTGSHAGSAELARNPGDLKPKGKNLTEEGFDGKEPNASFNNPEIGSENDPARVAEGKYQLRDAQSGADAGGGPRQGKVTGEGVYDALKSDEGA
ncbi:hypothetical protein K469DRAFT_707398 [Zopfia rhizophila CBS 207.26]|uniref:Uncharacterized protein n=1 Tax=Zopfia rhizophila CBS 207.26 TaxID=1314779 RepID=A0A6A6E4Q2_9PEZI|nr:hypothetical protein K469DRAFT_707398 [Zopfia rhizophila CBS 207.26]